MYSNCFHVETLSISSFQDQIVLDVFRWGLLAGEPDTFSYKMGGKPYETYAEAYEVTLQYGNTDESKLQRLEARSLVEKGSLVVRNDRREKRRQLTKDRPRPPLSEVVNRSLNNVQRPLANPTRTSFTPPLLGPRYKSRF